MNDANSDLTDAYRAYERLLTHQQSLVLATVNKDGSPLVSYAPYIVNEHKRFYIFISQLAAHTANLQHSGQASLMLIEDEATATQLFARQRLTFQCRATPVARHSLEWNLVMVQYRDRFGAIVELLESLPDFQLFQLTPTSGQLVLGFGQAYELSGAQWGILSHRER